MKASGTKAWLAAAMAAVVAGALVFWQRAETPAPEAAVEAAPVTLNRGLGQEAGTLDPHKSNTVQASTVQRDLFEGLLVYTPDGQLEGGVAERWEVSTDGLEYRFFLRPEARWSNGDAVTAEDFVFSFRRLVDPATASPFGRILTPVVNADEIRKGKLPPDALGVEAVGPHELVVGLRRPAVYFLQLMTKAAAMPVHAATIDAYPAILVSNGAYKLYDWSLGSLIEVHRNEHYHRNASTAIDVVRFHVAEEPTTEIYRYRAGELDTTSTIPAGSFQQLKEQMPDHLRIAQTLDTYFYGFNLTKAKLMDPRLREALALAIDREVLARDIVGRGEEAAYTFVPLGIHNYQSPVPPIANMRHADRVQRAKRLYEQAGYGPENPLELQVRYNNSGTHESIAIAVQAMWKEVLGFEAELINEELQVLIDNVQGKQATEVFRLSWSADYNDANYFLSILESDNPSNFFSYSNEEFDRLMKEAAEEPDPAARRLRLEEAERTLLADPPMIPIYYHVSKHLVNPRIRGWQDNVLDYHYSRHLSFEP